MGFHMWGYWISWILWELGLGVLPLDSRHYIITSIAIFFTTPTITLIKHTVRRTENVNLLVHDSVPRHDDILTHQDIYYQRHILYLTRYRLRRA
jgi:hypothetical protein